MAQMRFSWGVRDGVGGFMRLFLLALLGFALIIGIHELVESIHFQTVIYAPFYSRSNPIVYPNDTVVDPDDFPKRLANLGNSTSSLETSQRPDDAQLNQNLSSRQIEPRVAVLLVGRSDPEVETHPDLHIRTLLKEIVSRFNAQVFVVATVPISATERTCSPSGKSSYIKSSLRILTTHIKSISFVYPKGDSVEMVQCREHYSHVKFVHSSHHKEYSDNKARGYKQWQKLADAWNLMRVYEEDNGFKFDIVFKLRFDGIPYPWDKEKVYQFALSNPNVIRHASDYAFWGGRRVMKIACSLGSFFDSWWLAKRSKASSRPFSVKAFYQSMISTPQIAWHENKDGVWRFYSKIGAMWFPKVANGFNGGSPSDMMKNLWILYCRNLTYVDPLDPGSPIMIASSMGRKCPCNIVGNFRSTERDFPVWMIYHNVTLCDIGGGTKRFLFKGRHRRRIGYDECMTTIERENLGCEKLETDLLSNRRV
ncbi:hypothetical protein AAMO2058_000072500 [Amorphochlora amoebiformis]